MVKFNRHQFLNYDIGSRVGLNYIGPLFDTNRKRQKLFKGMDKDNTNDDLAGYKNHCTGMLCFRERRFVFSN